MKLNPSYVMNNLEEIKKIFNVNKKQTLLINLAKRDGLKCDCCSDDNISFIIQNNNLTMITNKRKQNNLMTADHDLLKSLGGSNNINNQHLLCSKCNTLRGDNFAEYKEFKQYYINNKIEKTKQITKNFCYLDFNKNIDSFDDIKHLTPGDIIPPAIKNMIINNFISNDCFIMQYIMNVKLLSIYNNSAWNNLLKELIEIYLKKSYNLNITYDSKFNITEKIKLSTNSCAQQNKNFITFLNKIIHKEIKTVLDLNSTK